MVEEYRQAGNSSAFHPFLGYCVILIFSSATTFLKRGCVVFFSDVWKDARGFYESMGWSPPDVILLRKKLNTKPSQPSHACDGATCAAHDGSRYFLSTGNLQSLLLPDNHSL
jgi:hypothetical protein